MGLRSIRGLTPLAALLAFLAGAVEAQAQIDVREDIALVLGVEAYFYGYPLVLMDVTREVTTAVAAPTPSRAPMNQFGHMRTFPSSDYRDMASPNADTLYSFAWLDLSREPMILHVPDTQGRFYLMSVMSAWSDVFASIGKRTTGTKADDFALLGPGWKGTLPEGMKSYRSPTNLVWIVGRTQTNTAADYEAARAIQKQYKLTPLSAFGKPYSPPDKVPVDPRIDTKTPPVDQVARMSANTFFQRLAKLLKDNPPAPADGEMIKKLKVLSVVPGQPFDISKLEPFDARGIKRAVTVAQVMLVLGSSHGDKLVNGWQFAHTGNYGTNYLTRAVIARGFPAANLTEDTIYLHTDLDSTNQPLNGRNAYVLRFEKGQTPPVNAFWSLTMYSAEHFFVPNPIHRFAIGDRDKLVTNPDGSLELYIQNTPPSGKEANWLPAPEGQFNLILRMYWPKPEAVKGTWKVPAVKRAR